MSERTILHCPRRLEMRAESEMLLGSGWRAVRIDLFEGKQVPGYRPIRI
jgi:hypothetical protein